MSWLDAPVQDGIYWAINKKYAHKGASICKIRVMGPSSWTAQFLAGPLYTFHNKGGWKWQYFRQPAPPLEFELEGQGTGRSDVQLEARGAQTPRERAARLVLSCEGQEAPGVTVPARAKTRRSAAPR